MLRLTAAVLLLALSYVPSAHAIKAAICSGDLLPLSSFDDSDNCVTPCRIWSCQAVRMDCYDACMDAEENAQFANPETWKLALPLIRAFVGKGLEPGSKRAMDAEGDAITLAAMTVYAKNNEQHDAWACATGNPSRGPMDWGDPPGVAGVWIYHTNPNLPGVCWYPGNHPIILTGNTLTTLRLLEQPGSLLLPHWTPPPPAPAPIKWGTGGTIDHCSNNWNAANDHLCNPNPNPNSWLPKHDPGNDSCFHDGTCTP